MVAKDITFFSVQNKEKKKGGDKISGKKCNLELYSYLIIYYVGIQTTKIAIKHGMHCQKSVFICWLAAFRNAKNWPKLAKLGKEWMT